MKVARQLAQVGGDTVGFAGGRRCRHDFRVPIQLPQQGFFLLLGQRCQVRQGGGGVPFPTLLGQFAFDAAGPGMSVLDVIHRIVIALGQREIDIEGQLGAGRARGEEETRGVAPHLVYQVPQGDVAARPLGQFDLLAIAHHGHHLVQDVIRPALGNP